MSYDGDDGFDYGDDDLDEGGEEEVGDAYDISDNTSNEELMETEANDKSEELVEGKTDEKAEELMEGKTDNKSEELVEGKTDEKAEEPMKDEPADKTGEVEEAVEKEGEVEHITCINERYEGKEHPETGVPYESREIEVEGKKYEVVVPRFDSCYEAQLPEEKYQDSDHIQFAECNSQLRNEIETNEELRGQFNDTQLEQIRNNETPDGYTWHHDAEPGRMQLVESGIHSQTRHTGGRVFWGGGNEKR